MSECGYCTKSLRNEDVKQIILCTGHCERAFHMRCTDLSETKNTRQYLLQIKSTWKCNECKTSDTDDKQEEPKQKHENMHESGIMKILTEINMKVSKIDMIETKLDHYETMINETIKKVDTMSKLLNDLKEEQKEVKKLKEENVILKNNLSALEGRISVIEQRSRLSNIEITGIPTTPKESTEEIVRKIGQVIGIEFRLNDIIVSHRVPTVKQGQPPNIICQLRDRRLKNEWMQQYKIFIREHKETGLQASHLHSSWPGTRIYLNVHLTSENKHKLHETKAQAKRFNYKYVWINNDGLILARKTDKSPILTIRSLEDIARLSRDNQQ